MADKLQQPIRTLVVSPPAWMTINHDEARWRQLLKRKAWQAYVYIYPRAVPMKDRLIQLSKPLGLGSLVSATVGCVVALSAIAALVGYRLWDVPAWVIEGANGSQAVFERVVSYRSAQAGVLGAAVQAVGGIAVALGLFFTWRQLRATQETHVDEQFAKAVEQLASSRPEVRVVAVHALERHALRPRVNRQPILHLLSVFLVTRCAEFGRPGSPERVRLPMDVQLALDALARIRVAGSEIPVSLSGIDLGQVNLSWSTVLAGLDLSGANFDDADLMSADLRRCDIRGASFRRCNLNQAKLGGSTAYDATFAGANLYNAVFRRAMASHAIIDGADLSHADFEWTHLSRADFRHANLTELALYGATGDFAHFEGQDLRKTKGLYDLLASVVRADAATVMPGKTPAEASKEMRRSEFSID